MSVKAKICGLTTEDSVEAAVVGGADYIGFVFFKPSPRDVTPQKAKELSKSIPEKIKRVGVLVDSSDDEIERILKNCHLDFLQLHGNETVSRVAEIKKKFSIPVIKAIQVRSSDDVAKGQSYSEIADMLLFDAKVPESPLPGGNGLSFDWTLLKERKFMLPWFLSGGINIANVKEAVKISGAEAVDISSSLESGPGIKDPGLVEIFLEKVKSL